MLKDCLAMRFNSLQHSFCIFDPFLYNYKKNIVDISFFSQQQHHQQLLKQQQQQQGQQEQGQQQQQWQHSHQQPGRDHHRRWWRRRRNRHRGRSPINKVGEVGVQPLQQCLQFDPISDARPDRDAGPGVGNTGEENTCKYPTGLQFILFKINLPIEWICCLYFYKQISWRAICTKTRLRSSFIDELCYMSLEPEWSQCLENPWVPARICDRLL